MKIKYVVSIIVIALVFVVTGCTKLNKKTEIKDLKSFIFSYSTGNEIYSNVRYELDCNENCQITIKPSGISDEDKYEVKVDYKFGKRIEDVLNKYNVASWNGFNKSDQNVLDGDSFSIYIDYNDNGYISASGYMMWPDNYSNVKNELNNMFMELYSKNE